MAKITPGVCLQARLSAHMHAFKATAASDCMEMIFSCPESSPATTHSISHTHTHNVPILECDTSAAFYLRLLLLIHPRIFALRSEPVAVVVEVVNDGHLHVLRLHLALLIRLASPSPRVTHTGCCSTAPGGAPAPEDNTKLDPSSSSCCRSCRRFAPLVRSIRCHRTPPEGGVWGEKKVMCGDPINSKGHQSAACGSRRTIPGIRQFHIVDQKNQILRNLGDFNVGESTQRKCVNIKG